MTPVKVPTHHPGPQSPDPFVWRVTIDDDDLPWLVVLHFARWGAEWPCVGYDVRKKIELSADFERDALPELTPVTNHQVTERLEKYLALARSMLTFDLPAEVHETAELRAGGQGRRGLPDAFFVQIADQYQAIDSRGGSPTTELAKAHRVARSTASKWIARCRERRPPAPRRTGEGGLEMRGRIFKRGSTWTTVYDELPDEHGKRRQRSKGGFRDTPRSAGVPHGPTGEAGRRLLRSPGQDDRQRLPDPRMAPGRERQPAAPQPAPATSP